MDDFWDDHVDDKYTGPPLTDDMVRAAEGTLGVMLPESYLRFLRIRNGGYVRRACFPVPEPDAEYDEPVRIETIRGVGYPHGIEGLGRFDLDDPVNRGGPVPGLVIFADTPSGGHDFVALDYRDCGPRGEPRVTHVGAEGVITTLVLAPDFETFARGLVDCAPYDAADDVEDEEPPGRRPGWRFW